MFHFQPLSEHLYHWQTELSLLLALACLLADCLCIIKIKLGQGFNHI